MNILIPMAGAGSRFVSKGYKIPKPLIPLTSRHSLQTVPMVVEAVNDLPVDFDSSDTKLLFIIRDFHQSDGVEKAILIHFPHAQFIVLDSLSNGQANTCLQARTRFDTNKPLMIAACDNGMDVSRMTFEKKTNNATSLIFSFRNNETVLDNPNAYGWVQTNETKVTGLSVKQAISSSPMDDHAIVGTFWFRHGHDFFNAADRMIAADDHINGEFYVDQVFKYLLHKDHNAQVLEVDRYLCWGTPEDYESYEATLDYWKQFVRREGWVE
jgi:dTDP-glucose pyrophosphorylase